MKPYHRTCDDRNLPWKVEKMKKIVLIKNHACNAYSRDKYSTDKF